MLNENPMKKVAVVGSARVEWPRVGISALGLRESKAALEGLLPKAGEVLSTKGYTVTFCEPAGVGYNNNSEVLVYENYGEEGNDTKKWKKPYGDPTPAYEYPAAQNNREFGDAIRHVFRGIESAISTNRLDLFTPNAKDLSVIGQATGADTICFVRVYGTRYSTRRKVGVFLMTTAFSPYGVGSAPKDYTESFFICADAKTGAVLWQHGEFSNEKNLDKLKTYGSL